MRLKRILALSTAAVLAAAMLTGCPWEPDAPAPSEPSSSSSSSRPSHDDEDDTETPDEPDEPDKPDEPSEPGEGTETPENPDEGGEGDDDTEQPEDSGVLTITGGNGKLTEAAFEGVDKTKITELDLSGSGYTSMGASSIGDILFEGWTNLKSVILPDNLTSIGYLTFDGCANLTSVTLPDSLTNIGEYAFNGCKSLQAIRVGTEFLTVTMNDGVFQNVPVTVTIYYPSELETSLDALKEKLGRAGLNTDNYKPDSKYEEDTKPTETTPELPDGAKGLLEMARLFGL